MFSESVADFDASDVTVGGTATTGLPTVSAGPGTTYTVTVPVSADGTVIASVAANGAHDVAANGNTASTSTDNSVLFDTTAPTVLSINRAGSDPTNASSVNFTVTFSESVSGVDNADFTTVEGGGLSGSSVTGVSGTGSTRTVTVNTGTGDGTVGLNLVDDDSILDSLLYPLGGTGPSNGDFTGQAYTVDKTPPATPSITASNPASPSTNASPLLSGTADAGTTIKIYNNASCTTQVGTGSAATFTGAGITATATPNTTTSFYATSTDAAGNVSACSTPAFTYLHDNTAPTVLVVTSPVANGTYGIGAVIPVTVQFSEPVTVTGTPQLTLSTGTPTTTAVNYTGGSGTDTLTFTYTVVAGNSSADLNYPLTTSLALNGGTVKDGVGNNATLTLPATGNGNSLGGSKAIVIGTTAANGDGTMTVAPTSVTAGSTGNSLVFTFSAPAGKDFAASSRVSVAVPTGTGWTTPQSTTSGNPGFVTVANATGTSCAPSISGIASNVITVNQTCAHGDALTITYAGGGTAVTATQTAGNVTFTTQSRNGASTMTNLTAGSPVVTVNPGAATNLNFLQSPTTAASGATISPVVTVRIRDAFNNVVTSDNTTNVTVALTNPNGAVLSGTTTVQAVNGVATFSTLSVDKAATGYTMTATSSPALTAATSAGFNITAGSATKLAITSINGGVTPVAGTPFNVVIQSQDNAGNPSPVGSLTQISLDAQGNGIVNSSGPLPGGSSTITLSLTYFNNSGIYPESGILLSASRTSGAPLTTANTVISVNPPTCTSIDVLDGPTTVTAGVVSTAFTVEAESPFGNSCGIPAGTVTLGQGTATGTFSSDAAGNNPVTSLTWSGGSGAAAPGPHQAVFYYRDTVAGPHTLTVGSTGLTGTSAPLTVDPGPASKLAFATVPPSVSADNTFSVIVQSQDQFGNVSPVASSTPVTLALASGTGPLNGFVPASIPAGQSNVTFSGLSDHLAEAITLSATASGLTSATSPSITITPGAATHVAYVQQPSNGTGGSPITPAVTVRLLDQFENQAASNATVTLAFGNNPSGAVVSGGSVAAVNGLATFTNLSVDKAGTGYTLVASSGALTTATSSAFDIGVGPATTLTFSQQPTNTTAGQAIAPVAVQVSDAGGNLVSSGSANVTLAIGTNPGSATLGGTLTQPTVGGVATFSDLSITKAANGYTLTAASSPLTGATSSTFNITPDAASKLVITSSPISVKINTNSANLTVQRRDQFDNPVTTGSTTVNLSSSAVTGEFRDATTPTTVITSVAISGGSSTAVFKYRDSVAGSPTVTVAATGLTSGTQVETILPNNAPPVPTLSGPIDGAATNDTTPTFTWNSVTDPDGDPVTYEIQVDDNSNFSSPVSLSPTATGLSTTTYTPTTTLTVGAAPGTVYFWRVRATDGAATSNFSSVRSVFETTFGNWAISPPTTTVRQNKAFTQNFTATYLSGTIKACIQLTNVSTVTGLTASRRAVADRHELGDRGQRLDGLRLA